MPYPNRDRRSLARRDRPATAARWQTSSHSSRSSGLRCLKPSLLLALIALAGAEAVIAAAAWLSFQVLINPDLGFLLNQYLSEPAAGRLAPDPPQTLVQLQATLHSRGLRTGPWLSLAPEGQGQELSSAPDLLLPIWTPIAGCQPSCQQLRELRVYRPLRLPAPLSLVHSRQYFRLLDRRPIVPPRQSEVIVPIGSPNLANYGSTQRLPFTQVQRGSLTGLWPSLGLQGQRGVWLQVSGRSPGSGAYGQMLYYSVEQEQLRVILDWSSPVGDSPTWQALTAGGLPELVVNRTVGLAPSYQIYQVQPAVDGFPTLYALSLSPPALADPAYQAGLDLAQAGLWSAALARLTSLQKKQTNWSAAAQAQLDVVRFHAQIAAQQAEQPMMSPGQKVLALLMDGRWQAALQRWQATPGLGEELQPLLQAESYALLRRVEVVLSLQPGQPEILIWGAVITAASQGNSAAQPWLRQQSGGQAVSAQAQTWVQRLAAAPPSQPTAPKPSTSSSPAKPTTIEPVPAPQLSPAAAL